MASVRPSNGIGDRVSKYRRLSGLTARELAERSGLGLTRGIITNIENGRKTDITVDQLIALATVLGVPPVVLAMPVDKPYYFVRLNGDDDTDGTVRLGFQAVGRFVATETGADHPAAYVASELLQSVRELIEANRVKRNIPDPDLHWEMDEKIAQVENALRRLGADLHKPQFGE